MSKADPAKQNAVIMWMGYDAPDSFVDPRIANPELARAGGDLLAGDVNSRHITHAGVGQSNITVLGHSHGSTTVADAFAGSGMEATNAVLLGCPGTDLAQSAADFDLQGGQVYVGNASTDPIGWIGSESLYGMAAIASGHGDALGELGMLAGERTAPTIGTPDRIPTPFRDIPLPNVDVPVGPAVIDPEVGREMAVR